MFPLNPFEYVKVTMQAARIMVESQQVIALRVSGMAGMWTMNEGETARMVNEKLSAGMQAGSAAFMAGMSGASMTDIAMAAMKPVGKRTRANAKRLKKQVMTP